MTRPGYGVAGAHLRGSRAEGRVETQTRLERGTIRPDHAHPVIISPRTYNPTYDWCRGDPVFARWVAEGWTVLREQVSLPTANGAYVGPPTYLIIGIPTAPTNLDAVRSVAARPDCAVIVDVTFPLTGMGGIVSMARDLHVSDEDMQKYFRDVDAQHIMYEALRIADAVTLSRAEWPTARHFLKAMRTYNENTFVLADIPDQPSDAELDEFARKLMRAWKSIIREKAVRST